MKSCPVCHTPLRTVRVGSVAVDECGQCKGQWFEDRELRLAKDQANEHLAWMDFEIWKHPERFKIEPRHLTCPSCQKELVAVQYGSTEVSVDFCRSCRGVWLDKGAFGRIVRTLADEQARMPASKYLKASLEQAEELVKGEETFVSEWRDLKAVLRLLQLRFFVEHPRLMSTILGIESAG